MKNLIPFGILIFLSLTLNANDVKNNITKHPTNTTNNYDSFTKGWEKGYVDGYCYRILGCIEPIVPIAPIPRIDESTYEDGYKRGFLTGRAKRVNN